MVACKVEDEIGGRFTYEGSMEKTQDSGERRSEVIEYSHLLYVIFDNTDILRQSAEQHHTFQQGQKLSNPCGQV